jgi:3-hydroxyisobutyrate dehydrogenase-like beta-hydroxyacid dehydrogenase
LEAFTYDKGDLLSRSWNRGQRHGVEPLKRDFSPSFALKLMLKDADLIEKFCSSLQLPIPALGVVEKNLAAAVALGFGTENVSALIKALEKETGVEVKARRVRRSTETEQSD